MNRLALTLSSLVLSVCGVVSGAESMRLCIDADLTPPTRHAVNELVAAIKSRDFAVTEHRLMDHDAKVNFVVGRVAVSPLVDELLRKHKLAVADPAESLLIHKFADETPSTIILAGRDDLGLAYAVLEAAEAVRYALPNGDLISAIQNAVESPRLRTRAVQTQIFNADIERPWFFSEDYWHEYFAMLARNRFNNYTLTFGHQTNYMTPPFPWLFQVAEYPQVHVEGLKPEEQLRNLQMLRRIAEIASEHGIDFTLGIWTQQPVQDKGMNYGPTLVRNFPAGDEASDYCAKGLRQVLEACPAIRGVQLRMNNESGIPEDRQKAYFQAQFDAIKNCGHPVRIDMRYKGLSQATIDQGVSTGLEVTVSTKFWCEHMGLPFHPTTEDANYSRDRYGYGPMLFSPRNYRVVYQLWNVGSSRLLLWGDPTYAARFAESCAAGQGDGFEFFAPLTNKGYGNEPGDWSIFADRSLAHTQWEFQRYWLYYLTFGRMGYQPQTSPAVWQRQLRNRFGDAAREIETAYRQASQILPLVTATRQFSASGWRFWPEMSTCMPLAQYMRIQPSDYGQFYPIARWEWSDAWMAEAWASTHSSFAEDAVAGKVDARWTPPQVSRKLDQLADDTLAALAAAQSKAKDPKAAEFCATELDFRVLAQLARYHAAKIRSATHLEFFRVTSETGRLRPAQEQAQLAAAAWQELVRLTDGMFAPNLVFGFSEKLAAQYNRRIHVHAGHWKDRLPEVRADVQYVTDLIAKHGNASQKYRKFAGETPLEHPPRIQHTPVTRADPAKDIEITVTVESSAPLKGVVLHHRRMDQTQTWEHVSLEPSGDDTYQGVIPGRATSAAYDHLYYLEALVDGGGTLWPNWEEQTPYVVVSTAPKDTKREADQAIGPQPTRENAELTARLDEALPNEPSPERVAEVLEGKRRVANAAWWGVDEQDSTEMLQRAFNSKAEFVYVPNLGRPWILSRNVQTGGNQQVVFAPGVVVQAMRGKFRGASESLIGITGKQNVTVHGYGATFRMFREDYTKPPYEKGEWRNTLALRSCTNVKILGLTLCDSGGDGLYISNGGGEDDPNYSKDIQIRDVVCDGNHRQGISVISAENLLIENCLLRNTHGTGPSAGIDLEPDDPAERLVNVVIRNCIAESNDGPGFMVYLNGSTGTKTPVSVLFDRCRVASGKAYGLVVGAANLVGTKSAIEFRDCEVQNTGQAGALIYDKLPDGVDVKFVRCSWSNVATEPATAAASPEGLSKKTSVHPAVPLLVFLKRRALADRIGGVRFEDCRVIDSQDRPVLAAAAAEPGPLVVQRLHGNIQVQNPHGARTDLGPMPQDVDVILQSSN